MFDADVFVFHLLGFLFRIEEDLLQPSCRVHVLSTSGNLRQLVDLAFQSPDDLARVHFHELEQLRDQSVLLHKERQMKMFSIYLLMTFFYCYILTVYYCTLCILCVFFYVHKPHLRMV